MTYRKIYKKHHGSIPVDDTGRTYDIHHIDGDRKNNDIKNLVALSIEDHYLIHLEQNDYQAAAAIRMRWDKDIAEISKLNSIAAKKRVSGGIHHWLGDGSYQRDQQEKLKSSGDYYQYSQIHKDNISHRNKEYSSQGIHNFQTEESRNAVSERNRKNIEAGIHPFCKGIGAENSRNRIIDGTHHFLNSDIQRNNSMKAKLVNSIRVKRIDVATNDEVIFIGISDAIKHTPNTKRRSIQKAYETGKKYCGYMWISLGKGGSSTTISSESTDQVIGKHSTPFGDDIV